MTSAPFSSLALPLSLPRSDRALNFPLASISETDAVVIGKGVSGPFARNVFKILVMDDWP